MDDLSKTKLMKYKKEELCMMIIIAMGERNRWEAEFYNLEGKYDELLKYKNHIRDKYVNDVVNN